ncbi:MAG: OmpA family protein [Pseudomonadota bacterium]
MADYRVLRGVRCRAGWRSGACWVLVLGLAGCSTPDWADPDEWFDTQTPETQQVAAEGVDEDAPYPSLASVPDAPPRPSPEEQRAALADGLLADHANARYSEQVLTHETTAVPEAEPPIAPQSAAVGTPPLAEPTPPAAAPTTPAAAPLTEVEPAALQEAALAPVPDLSDGGTLVAVIYFAEGAEDLTGDDRALLTEVMTLQRQRDGDLRVVGHDSARRPESGLNGEVDGFERSLARANAVAETLVVLGLPPERLAVLAAGDSLPVYDESAASGAAGNRRVEIFLR